GNQWVRAIDSVAANLSEGFGRFHFKENKQFCFYARGSLFESQTWLVKAHSRQLIDDATFLKLQRAHTRLIFILNRYIQSIGSTHSP
ncbi:MAG: four helix bundle protein, partial [Rhodothermales bacterium]